MNINKHTKKEAKKNKKTTTHLHLVGVGLVAGNVCTCLVVAHTADAVVVHGELPGDRELFLVLGVLQDVVGGQACGERKGELNETNCR